MKLRKASVIILFLALLMLAAFWVPGQLAIDSCLDAGGAWDYEQEMCRYK